MNGFGSKVLNINIFIKIHFGIYCTIFQKDWHLSSFLQFSLEKPLLPLKNILDMLASFVMLLDHHFEQTHHLLPLTL
jgi:hypothetical protein